MAEIVAREAEYEFQPANYFRPLRWEDVFPEPDRPVEVDLGSGYGTFAIALAERFPSHNILAVEREGDRVDLLCRKAAAKDGLSNLRGLHLESSYTVRYLLPDAGVDVLHLLFPDPWPKKRHHKRRIINAAFREDVLRVLKPGGELRFATDHQGYFESAREIFLETNRFAPVPWPGDGDPAYPVTDFQKIWKEQGKTLHYLTLRKLTPS